MLGLEHPNGEATQARLARQQKLKTKLENCNLFNSFLRFLKREFFPWEKGRTLIVELEMLGLEHPNGEATQAKPARQ